MAHFFSLYTSGNCREQNVITFFSDFPILSEINDFYEIGTFTFSIIAFLQQHFFAFSLSDIYCNILH